MNIDKKFVGLLTMIAAMILVATMASGCDILDHYSVATEDRQHTTIVMTSTPRPTQVPVEPEPTPTKSILGILDDAQVCDCSTIEGAVRDYYIHVLGADFDLVWVPIWQEVHRDETETSATIYCCMHIYYLPFVDGRGSSAVETVIQLENQGDSWKVTECVESQESDEHDHSRELFGKHYDAIVATRISPAYFERLQKNLDNIQVMEFETCMIYTPADTLRMVLHHYFTLNDRASMDQLCSGSEVIEALESVKADDSFEYTKLTVESVVEESEHVLVTGVMVGKEGENPVTAKLKWESNHFVISEISIEQ